MTFVPNGNQSIEHLEDKKLAPDKRPLAPPYADAQYYYDPDFQSVESQSDDETAPKKGSLASFPAWYDPFLVDL
jgi:hypothetical protein